MRSNGVQTRRRLIRILAENPGLTYRDIALVAGRSVSTAHSMVTKMLTAGLLSEAPCSTCGHKGLRVTPDGLDFMEMGI